MKKKKAPTPAAFQSNSKTDLYETFLKKNSHINQKNSHIKWDNHTAGMIAF